MVQLEGAPTALQPYSNHYLITATSLSVILIQNKQSFALASVYHLVAYYIIFNISSSSSSSPSPAPVPAPFPTPTSSPALGPFLDPVSFPASAFYPIPAPTQADITMTNIPNTTQTSSSKTIPDTSTLSKKPNSPLSPKKAPEPKVPKIAKIKTQNPLLTNKDIPNTKNRHFTTMYT
jgi:hypothetical protein